MAIETEKSIIGINQLVVKKIEKVEIEGDCIVPDVKPDILEVISSSGIVSIYKKEITEGRIKIDGCITTYIMYTTNTEEGNKVRSITHNLDFSQILSIPDINSNMIDNSVITLDNVECKIINERKVSIKAYLKIELKVFQTVNNEYITNVKLKDIQKLESDIKINSVVGVGHTKASVKESVKLEETDNLAEVLKMETTIINKEIKVSYNKVLAKADLKVRMLYSTEDNSIKSKESVFSFVGFIDIQDVNENNVFDTNYEIKNLAVNCNGSKDHSIMFETEIGIDLVAYKIMETKIIKDMYSPSVNILVNKKSIKAIQNKQKYISTYNINQNNVSNIESGSLYDVNYSLEVENVINKNNEVEIIGTMNCNIIYMLDNKFISKKEKIPITYNIAVDNLDNNTSISVNYSILNESYNLMQGGNVSIKLDVCFEIECEETVNLELIESITESDELKKNDYNMVIYFTQENDTIWNIAKKFNSTTQNIIETNEIEEDSIKPGTRLLISRYV